jgi:PAS domain S-box-containing protein
MNDSSLATPPEEWPSIIEAQASLLANRLNHLSLLAQSSGPARASALELASEEFSGVVEELQTAYEELRTQGEQLAEAHGDLERARRRYQDLFDFAPDPIVLTDAVGRIEAANLAVSGLVGFARKYVLGKPIVAFIAPEATTALAARIRALVGAPADRVAEFETTFRPRGTPPARRRRSSGRCATSPPSTTPRASCARRSPSATRRCARARWSSRRCCASKMP